MSNLKIPFHQFGFFNRTKKDELDRLVQQNPVEPEAENLNSGGNN